ncbi:hypothetical protein ES319_D05G224100v1 [Gossypium barbadense]|uniref:Uncharacterized protein n=2 Tax=Gossypium TaxID=3633 RepID=A0A5J5RFN2_GOSBA|nr:hypothetical protein ES319_D05G224100v1 [Gossypium barbadense]TYG69499.1 hypothetical protein ES288_D05G235300v1 [Gossypium darwinii]
MKAEKPEFQGFQSSAMGTVEENCRKCNSFKKEVCLAKSASGFHSPFSLFIKLEGQDGVGCMNSFTQYAMPRDSRHK